MFAKIGENSSIGMALSVGIIWACGRNIWERALLFELVGALHCK